MRRLWKPAAEFLQACGKPQQSTFRVNHIKPASVAALRGFPPRCIPYPLLGSILWKSVWKLVRAPRLTLWGGRPGLPGPSHVLLYPLYLQYVTVTSGHSRGLRVGLPEYISVR